MSTALNVFPVTQRHALYALGGVASANGITRDDIRLLSAIASGDPITCVAERVGISDRTVRRRVHGICEVLGVKTAMEAVVWAARHRLI